MMERSSTPEPVNLTPPSTELRGMGSQVIVDVSLDANGQQVYSVHDISALGPRNGQALNQTPTQRTVADTGIVSPESIQRKRSVDSSMQINESKRIKVKHEDSQDALEVGEDEDGGDEDAEQIWSQDVQDAFVEALGIIPKKGLNKIKVSGRSCGRNELISDFIRTKTGKVRTRKQVSSHIQVIKNLNKDDEIIDLIKNGPSNTRAARRFDDVFSSITFAKSLGNDLGNVQTAKMIQESPVKAAPKDDSVDSGVVAEYLPQPESHPDLSHLDMLLLGFEMSYQNGARSHVFSMLRQSDFLDPPLRIKENANITKRFPDLYGLVGSISSCVGKTGSRPDVPPVPIIHGMVALNAPPLSEDLVSGKYSVASDVSMTGIADSDRCWCVYTTVYSFGRQVVATFEKLDPHFDGNQVEFKIRLANDYWNALFEGIGSLVEETLRRGETVQPLDQLVASAVRGITVQQCVFIADSHDMKRDIKRVNLSLSDIDRHKVRAILLWEFSRVDPFDNAQQPVTTMRRIYPPRFLCEKSPVSLKSEPKTQSIEFLHQAQTHGHLQHPGLPTITPSTISMPGTPIMHGVQQFAADGDLPGAGGCMVQIKSEDEVGKLEDYFW
ncbi:unnamed protein product [Kuraishia capsulata CBS 1993]|uniref:TEA domain-containing protein n=1 Tax=Kuraishia capsulata CBS 1993 TaxID=1382522 RepID=W6MRQ0_9ASCO|nr:uncharacterized protein KUCA_T00005387001 [Kuraishia capsulata CBS 1993]CDK29399.1 unnamed protein product [Kuraishia capsulata CBS 1993]